MHGYFLQIDSARMGKSAGNFLRVQTLIDEGYDPLAYRFMCLGAHYRSQLSFSWEVLDGAKTALNRLRAAVYGWGEPGTVDEDYIDKFAEHVSDDLNMPRVLALTWDLVKSDLPDATKKATVLFFDQVMGLRLAEWEPVEEVIPDDIMVLVEQRAAARKEKRWQDADALRAQVTEAGYEIEDTPQGPRVRKRA
jgi:cysteinyl-tRNA synthetase